MNHEEIKRFLRGFQIYEFIGLEILESEPGLARCRVSLNDATSNHIGTVHAGVQWMIAEVVGGVIAMQSFDTRRYVPVVRSLDIQFERRAVGAVMAEGRFSESERRRVESALVEDGKADFELDIVIVDETRRVATARGRYHLREDHRG